MNPPDTPRRPVDLSTESVAGEEDPGAMLDLDAEDMRAGSAHDSKGAPMPAPGASPPMRPGDEAPAGTPGTGEDVCPRCGGSGRIDGAACATCSGTGKVTVGIGGA